MERDRSTRCDYCKAELTPGEAVYRMDEKLMCTNCFRSWLLDLLTVSPGILAGRLGLDSTTI